MTLSVLLAAAVIVITFCPERVITLTDKFNLHYQQQNRLPNPTAIVSNTSGVECYWFVGIYIVV
jgi:hypothetical protein